MKYRIIFEVYDNTGEQKVSEKLSKDLTDPKAREIKALLNPGTYTNIRKEKLMSGNKVFTDDSIVDVQFINYTIHLA